MTTPTIPNSTSTNQPPATPAATEPGPPAPAGTAAPAAVPETPKPEIDWKAEARKHEQRAKENKAAADELAALKAAQQTEAERTADKLAAAEQRAADLTARTVQAEVRALAAGTFQDPSDAHLYLDLSKYADAAGEIDAEGIKADLAEVLTRKPHLAKAAGSPQMQIDPAQGARPNGTSSFDQRIAEATKAGDHRLAIALKQQRAASLKS